MTELAGAVAAARRARAGSPWSITPPRQPEQVAARAGELAEPALRSPAWRARPSAHALRPRQVGAVARLRVRAAPAVRRVPEEAAARLARFVGSLTCWVPVGARAQPQ